MQGEGANQPIQQVLLKEPICDGGLEGYFGGNAHIHAKES